MCVSMRPPAGAGRFWVGLTSVRSLVHRRNSDEASHLYLSCGELAWTTFVYPMQSTYAGGYVFLDVLYE